MTVHVKAVATAYRPNVGTLAECLAATAPQVEDVVLVANDGAPWSFQLPANGALLRQAKNIGLGAAYNLAARWRATRGRRTSSSLTRTVCQRPAWSQRSWKASNSPAL